MQARLSLPTLVAGLAAALFLIPSTLAAEENAAIEYVMTQGIMLQDRAGDFQPGTPATRLEFTLAVVKTLYPEISQKNCFRNIASSLPVRFTRLFRDVENTESYAPGLCVAVEMGLVHGDRDANFRPFDPITVAEASKILAHAQGFTYPSRDVSTKPWYWSSMEALRTRAAIAYDALPGSHLDRAGMAQMFYATRNSTRYPDSRVIGQRPATEALPPVLCAGTTCDDVTGKTKATVTTLSARTRTTDERLSRRALRRALKNAGRL